MLQGKWTQMLKRKLKNKRHLILVALLSAVLLIALFQYVQLRQIYIEDLQRLLELSGERLNTLVHYQQGHLINLAKAHELDHYSKSKLDTLTIVEKYFNINLADRSFEMSQSNPMVKSPQMGTLLGINPQRFIEPDYSVELSAGIDTLDDLNYLVNFNKSVVSAFYYSYNGYATVQPPIETEEVMQLNGVNSLRQLYLELEKLVSDKTQAVSFHPLKYGIIHPKPVMVLTVPVVQDNSEWGSYGILIDLELLIEEISFGQGFKAPVYFFSGEQILVRWQPDKTLDLIDTEYVRVSNSPSVHYSNRNLGSYELLYIEPNLQYGLGLEINEWMIFIHVLPQMTTYLLLCFILALFFIGFERIMVESYYKPIAHISSMMALKQEDRQVLNLERSHIWAPIYEGLKDYFNLLSITGSLPGAIVQVVKQNNKYSVNYSTKGLEELLNHSEDYALPKGADFLGLFDTNSYWNLENLLKDSETYMIPISYEAVLNSDHQQRVFVNIALKPLKDDEKNVYWEGMLINVTDRRLLEQELSDEKDFVEKLFDLSGALFCVLDPSMTIVRCNQSFLSIFFQNPDESQLVYDFEKLFTPFDLLVFKEQFNHILEGAPAGLFEHYWIMPDGRKKLFKTNMAPIEGQENRIEYVILTAIDISDRYKIEEELKKTNQTLYLRNAQVERSARIQKELFKTFEELRHVDTFEAIYSTLTKVIGQVSHFHNFLMALKVDKTQSDMQVFDYSGDFTTEEHSIYFHYFKGIIGRVIMTRTPYISGNALSDPDYIVDDEKVRSVIYIPITYNDFLWGVLGINSYLENAFSKMDFEIMNVLGSHLGLYMEELHSRLILKNEADQLRGLHHVIQDISALRNNNEIAQKIVENGLLKHLAVFRTVENGEYDLIAESEPTSLDLYGIMPNYAILDHAISKNRIINGRIGALNVFHLANPVLIDGKIVGILYSIKDHEFTVKDEELILIISEQMAVFWRLNDMIEKANRDALIDSLTGIWNRRYMIDRMLKENHRNQRYNATSALAIIDLGEFKSINDTYGHDIGDQVLCEVAQDFTRLIRDSDFVGRYGGDEFIIYMPNCTYEQGVIMLDRLSYLISESLYSAKRLKLHIDYGIVSIPTDSEDLSEALKIADERMYLNKKSRKVLVNPLEN